MNENKVLSIRVSYKTYKQLCDIANKESKKVSCITNRIIKNYLQYRKLFNKEKSNGK